MSETDGMTTTDRRSWLGLVLLTAVYVFNQVDRRVVSLVIEPIKAEFSLSDTQLGILTGLAFGIIYALMVIPLGLIADRVSRRNLLAIVAFVWSIMTAFGGFAQSYTQLVLVRMGVGAAEAGASPTAISIISDTFPPNRRATALAIFQTANSIGAILCFVAGAWIVTHFGWRAAFLAAGLPGIPIALLLCVSVSEPRRGAMDNDAQQFEGGWVVRLKSAFGFIAGDRTVLFLVIAPALAAAGSTGLIAWFPSFLIRVHGLDIREAGLVVAMSSGICGGVGLILSGIMADRFARGDPTRMLLASAAIVTITVISAATAIISPLLLGTIIAIGIFGLFCYAYIGVSYAALLNLTPVHMRGTVIAVEMVSANLVGYGGGPFVVGVLSDTYGGAQSLRWALLTLNLFYVAAALCFLVSGLAALKKRRLNG